MSKPDLAFAHRKTLSQFSNYLNNISEEKPEVYKMWLSRSSTVKSFFEKIQTKIENDGIDRFRNALIPAPWETDKLTNMLYDPGTDGGYHLVYLTICLPELSFYFGVCSDNKGIQGNYIGSGRLIKELLGIYRSSDFIRLPVMFLNSVDDADFLENIVVCNEWRSHDWTLNVIDGGRTGRKKLDVNLPVYVMWQHSTRETVKGTRDDLLKIDTNATRGGLNRLIAKAKGKHSDFIYCGLESEWDALHEELKISVIRANRAFAYGGNTIEQVMHDLNTGKTYSGYQYELNEIAESLGISRVDLMLRNPPGEKKHRSLIYCGTLDEWKNKSDDFKLKFINETKQRFTRGRESPTTDKTEYVLLDRKDKKILIGTRNDLRLKTDGTGYPLRNDMFRYFGRNRRYTVLTVRTTWIEMPNPAQERMIKHAMRL